MKMLIGMFGAALVGGILSLNSLHAGSSAKNSYLDEVSQADLESLDLAQEDFEAVLDTSTDNDWQKLDALIEKEVSQNDSALDKLAAGLDENGKEKIVEDKVDSSLAAPVRNEKATKVVDSPRNASSDGKNIDQVVGGSAPLFQ